MINRGSKGSPATECRCGSSAGVERGMCVDCRREYGREYYRRKLATNAAKGGPLIPREKRGFCLQKKKPAPYTAIAPSQRTLDPYVPIAPVLEVGRRIPAPDAPMAEKLECVEWVAYFERNEMLEWAMREAQRQALLGHTKATTTMGYTTVDLEQMRAAMDRPQ